MDLIIHMLDFSQDRRSNGFRFLVTVAPLVLFSLGENYRVVATAYISSLMRTELLDPIMKMRCFMFNVLHKTKGLLFSLILRDIY